MTELVEITASPQIIGEPLDLEGYPKLPTRRRRRGAEA